MAVLVGAGDGDAGQPDTEPGTAHLLPGPREAVTSDSICSSLPFPNRGIRPRPESQASGTAGCPLWVCPKCTKSEGGAWGGDASSLRGARRGMPDAPFRRSGALAGGSMLEGVWAQGNHSPASFFRPPPPGPPSTWASPCLPAQAQRPSCFQCRALCLPVVCRAGHAIGIGGTHRGKRTDCRWVRHPEAWGAGCLGPVPSLQLSMSRTKAKGQGRESLLFTAA